MSQQSRTRVAIVGCGGRGRGYAHHILAQQATTEIVVVCEPSVEAYARLCALCDAAGVPPPPNEPDLAALLRRYQGLLDVALIVTPHAYHHAQAKACLEAGLDVLLEKPMVVTAAEARDLIAARDRTGRLLVVAFDGSLSPEIRAASRILSSGEAGEVLNIVAYVWEHWEERYQGHWKQMPDISGGGFMFDTGAHMLNTVCDLAGEGFAEVAAWLANRERDVDILGCAMGRLTSGALVTMASCGAAIPSCASEVWVFCTKAIIRTGIWGERLYMQRPGERELQPVPVPESRGAWEQFEAIRSGKLANPSPPEIGLRMAQLWDAIKASAEQNGVPQRVG